MAEGLAVSVTDEGIDIPPLYAHIGFVLIAVSNRYGSLVDGVIIYDFIFI